MTEKEFTRIALELKAVYTNPKFLPDKFAIKVWYDQLEDLDFVTCLAVVKAHISRSKFEPTPADIRKAALGLSGVGEEMSISSLQAWAMVRRAIEDGINHANERFQELPKAAQMALGTPENIKEMAVMDTEAVERVEKGRFIHAYEASVQRIRDEEVLPPKVKELLKKAAAGVSIDAGEEAVRNISDGGEERRLAG